MQPLVSALLAIFVAFVAVFGTRFARRRLSALLARRRRERRDVRGLRGIHLLVALGQWALWLTAIGLASEIHPSLAGLRTSLSTFLGRTLASPLFAVGDRPVTTLDILLFPVAGAGIWLLSKGATHVLRASLLRAAGLEGGTEETVATLLRYGILFSVTAIALQAAGLDLRGIAILGGVLGVGIGFGLQNIANNFVSGILIGLERPIRPGDFVRVGTYMGTVVRVGGRSTTIRTLDRVSIVVPNSRFLESEVVNWSLDDPTTRVHVPVGVAYGSEVPKVRAALLAAARAHPAVVRAPRPQVQLREFGSSALHFELLVWTLDPKNQFTLVSDLNYLAEAQLARHGVRIPFEQMDLHVRTPGLEGLVRSFEKPSVEKAPAESEVPDAPEFSVLESVVREDRGPEEWTVAEVESAAHRLRSPEGVEVTDRRYLLRVYPRCFIGSEAVSWLAENENLTRSEARSLGERMLELGQFRHVLDEHGFIDGSFYYRFCPRDPELGEP